MATPYGFLTKGSYQLVLVRASEDQAQLIFCSGRQAKLKAVSAIFPVQVTREKNPVTAASPVFSEVEDKLVLEKIRLPAQTWKLQSKSSIDSAPENRTGKPEIRPQRHPKSDRRAVPRVDLGSLRRPAQVQAFSISY